MAKTPDTQRGTTPASAKSSKHKKRGDIDDHNDDNNSTPKKPKKDDSKRKKDATTSKINAEPLILPVTNADENEETHSEKELSSKNKESKGSNMDVLESTVRNKNNIFHFGKYCLYLQSHIIIFLTVKKRKEATLAFPKPNKIKRIMMICQSPELL